MRGKDLAQFDVKLLQLFDVLYTTRSVTRAAQHLGQSQPTISIWLNRLRRQFNDQLFVRTANGMEPTLQADALIELIRSALAALKKLSDADLKGCVRQDGGKSAGLRWPSVMRL